MIISLKVPKDDLYAIIDEQSNYDPLALSFLKQKGGQATGGLKLQV